MSSGEDKMVSLERLAPLLILAAAVVSYANSFGGPFIFDDSVAVTNNPDISRLWPLNPGTRVLVDVTFKLNYAVDRLNVAGYHAVNLVIHALAGLFLYGFTRRTLLSSRLRGRYGSKATALALVSATIWVVHPLQTQSVTYIAQRYESMMGLFFLMTFYFFVRGINSSRPRGWFDAAIAACALGMATKPVIVTAPFLILLYDRVFHSGIKGSIRLRWKVHLALFLTLGIHAMLLLNSIAASARQGAAMTGNLTPLQYLLSQSEVLLHYIRLAFLPHPLCLDYAWPAVMSPMQVVGPLAVVGVLLLSTVWGVLRRHPLGFLGAWFFVILAPTSSVLPIDDLCVEHRMYLPLAAIVGGCVVGVHATLGGMARRLGVGGRAVCVVNSTLAVGVIGVLGFLTVMRNRDYRSVEVMARNILSQRPENFRQHVALISALISQGRYMEAEQAARELLVRTLAASSTPANRIRMRASDPAYYHAQAQNLLGRALLCQHRTNEAIACFLEAIRARPQDRVPRHNLAVAHYLAGRRDEALELTNQLISWASDYRSPRLLRAQILEEMGFYDKAAADYELILSRSPDCISAVIGLAWLRATAPDEKTRDGQTALRLAQQASEASGWRSVRAMDTLAAAYAELGRFDEAVRAAEKAIELLGERGEFASPTEGAGGEVDGEIAWQQQEGDSIWSSAGIPERLTLYRSSRPYRLKKPSPP